MLQIRLIKPSGESGGSVKPPAPADNVRVACPDHLVLADLPVAKSLGSASVSAVIKTVGRRSRRQLGERVHFCVRCDFPIAIYGRLSPCEHAFCLDCARSDSLCHLCDERVQKIQTIRMMEGIFICAAPHCLKSFLNKTEFESHINETHAQLIHPNKEKEGYDSEATSMRRSSASDSTVQAAMKPVLSSSNFQVHDYDEKSQRHHSRDPPPSRHVMHPPMPMPLPLPPFSGEQQVDGNQSQAFDRAGSQMHFPQHAFDPQGGQRQDSAPINPNPSFASPRVGYAPYTSDGAQQFYGASYEMGRPGPRPDRGSEQGTMLSFPPVPGNFVQNYPGQRSMGIIPGALEPGSDGFMNATDSQGRGFFPGDYAQSASMLPSNLPLPAAAAANKGMIPQSLPLPPPPPLPSPHLPHIKQNWTYPSDGNREPPPGFGWHPDRRDGFGPDKPL